MPVISTIAAATARAFGAFKAAAGGAADEFFNYVTLLLHGDGTNGAQNNTFLDSSTNNFAITRNGNTTQGTFSPFSQDDGKWGAYFDGSGDYLTLADNAAFAFGSGDFTIEGWVYNTGTNGFIFAQTDNSSVAGSAVILYITGGALTSLAYSGGSFFSITDSSSFPLNQWVHVAYVRASTTLSLYVNGVSKGTANISTNSINDATANISIGARNNGNDPLTGYISNLRVVKGTAVYTSAFTPSTTPLTAITNTSLLTCQSNRFKDNSANNFAITVNGNTSIQPFSPFAPSAAYSAATNGGSGYFDGSGDYLSVASSSTLAFGTGDFTIEGWYYPRAYSGDVSTILSTTTADSASVAAVNINVPTDGSMQIGGSFSTGAGSVPLNTWTHFVVSRVSGTIRLFINGVQKSSAANSTNYTSAGCLIGARYAGGQYYLTAAAYIAGLKFTVGSGVTSVTMPSAPPTGGNILLNFTNAGILDNTGRNDLETVGNAQISTSVKKFGTGSMYFDGTGDWLTAPASPNLAFGTGDYTVEFWLYKNSSSGERGVFQTQTASAYGLSIFLDATAIYVDERYTAYSASDPRVTTSFPSGQWVHIAICRSGGTSGTLRLFKDGVLTSSTTTNLRNMTSTGPLYVGYQSASANPLNGYIDDLRITKGVARYTSNFTPPTAAFEDQ